MKHRHLVVGGSEILLIAKFHSACASVCGTNPYERIRAQKSSVGKTVNSIGKSAEPGGTVQKVCKSLVGQWKGLVAKPSGNDSDTSSVSASVCVGGWVWVV